MPKILPRIALETYYTLLAEVTRRPNFSLIKSSTYCSVKCFTIYGKK